MSYNHNYYQETIQKMLYELVRDKDITVLMVTLIGSRAYGCAGPNSDYDIRFIYKQQEEAYLDVISGKHSDQIVFPTSYGYDVAGQNMSCDIVGWDVSKITRLLFKSNPTLLDWVMSPVIYYDYKGFHAKLTDLIYDYYQIPHLLGGYSGVWKSHAKETPTIKSELNLYRTSLQAEYVFKNNSLPLMNFDKLLKVINIPEWALAEIQYLIKEKAAGNGEKPYKLHTDYCAQIEAKFTAYPWEKEIAMIQKDDEIAKRKNALNKFFIQTIRDQV